MTSHSLHSAGPLWFLDVDELARTAQTVAYPPEFIETLVEAARELDADSRKQSAFLKFHSAWFSGETIHLPEPELSLWHALAVVASWPGYFKIHKERQIPWAITVATLSDLPRRVRNFMEVNGYPGFDAHLWMRNHVQGRLFEVGRLQYVPGKCFYPANLYESNGGLVAIARAGLICDAAGWPRREEQEGTSDEWRTTLTIESGAENGVDHSILRGHEIAPDGFICRTLRELAIEAPPLLHEESDVLHIHIPMGEKLSAEACLDSISAAFAFFEQYFPERQWASVCCGSWLLDNAFGQFLPPTSNIVAFGRLFTTLPWPGANHLTHLRWIFGKDADLDTARAQPNKNSLQRAVLDYLDGGGTLRARAGYILQSQLPLLYQRV